MNFFSFEPSGDGGRSSFIVSRHFWIYWAFAVPMTVVTLVMWMWWNRWAKHLTLSKSKADVPSGA
jgi:O-antigen/teichoic acid export membrane protein